MPYEIRGILPVKVSKYVIFQRFKGKIFYSVYAVQPRRYMIIDARDAHGIIKLLNGRLPKKERKREKNARCFSRAKELFINDD